MILSSGERQSRSFGVAAGGALTRAISLCPKFMADGAKISVATNVPEATALVRRVRRSTR